MEQGTAQTMKRLATLSKMLCSLLRQKQKNIQILQIQSPAFRLTS